MARPQDPNGEQTGTKLEVTFSTVIVQKSKSLEVRWTRAGNLEKEDRSPGRERTCARCHGYLCAGKFVRRLRLSLDRVDRVGPAANGQRGWLPAVLRGPRGRSFIPPRPSDGQPGLPGQVRGWRRSASQLSGVACQIFLFLCSFLNVQ